ncbi:MAG: hypothetical protein SZ59_C0001G0013 [candidate division TM6 bacterium GW2011_GWF2_28_16]|nr:MAG: hypothetical protein SZ59_C0001G0013 [candidate division TM6 bacterium GW2011_GWF2_28_16]
MKNYLKYIYILLLGFNTCFGDNLKDLSVNFKNNIFNLSQAISSDLNQDKQNLNKLLLDIENFFKEFELFKNNLSELELKEINQKIILLNEKLKEINTLDFVKNNENIEQNITEQITRLELLDLKLADSQVGGIQQVDAEKIDAVKTGFYQKTVKYIKDHKKVSALFLAVIVSGFYLVNRFSKPEEVRNSENNSNDFNPGNPGNDEAIQDERVQNLNPVIPEQPKDNVLNNDQVPTEQSKDNVQNALLDAVPVVNEPLENNFQESEIMPDGDPEERVDSIQVPQEFEQAFTNAQEQQPENRDERKYSKYSGRELVRSPLAEEIYKRELVSPKNVRETVGNLFGPGLVK